MNPFIKIQDNSSQFLWQIHQPQFQSRWIGLLLFWDCSFIIIRNMLFSIKIFNADFRNYFQGSDSSFHDSTSLPSSRFDLLFFTYSKMHSSEQCVISSCFITLPQFRHHLLIIPVQRQHNLDRVFTISLHCHSWKQKKLEIFNRS